MSQFSEHKPSAQVPEGKGSPTYPLSIRILHWLMALIIFGQIALGWYMTPWTEQAESLYYWHKSFGMLALFLVFLRIASRRRNAIPELPATLPASNRILATLSHKLLYVLMVAVPLAGYTDSSAFEFSSGIHFFGIDLPQVIPDNDAVHKAGNLLHKILSYGLLALVGLHALGAIKHRFFDADPRNDVFSRILIHSRDFARRKRC